MTISNEIVGYILFIQNDHLFLEMFVMILNYLEITKHHSVPVVNKLLLKIINGGISACNVILKTWTLMNCA